MISTSDLRTRFIAYLFSKLNRPVLWGAKGTAKLDNVTVEGVFDCSGLVTCALYNAGAGVDLRESHNAQKLADLTEPTNNPVEGDLVFYGKDWRNVVHVAVYMAGAKCLTASGATPTLPDIVSALKARAHVEIRPVLKYRTDYLGTHVNKWIQEKGANA